MDTYFGFKSIMTQTWDKTGHRFPVTVVSAPPMVVTQQLSPDKGGYPGIQVGIGSRSKKGNKPLTHHLKKSKMTSPPQYLREIRLKDSADFQLGQTIPVDTILALGDIVTVSGVSKGRGFTGGVKRWGFSGGPRTHGQSDRERAPGSIGQGTTPGRVHKGKKMAGHYGNQRFSIRHLQVIHLDPSTHTVWLSGPIPGGKGSLISINKTGTGTFASPDTVPHHSVEATPVEVETVASSSALNTAEVATKEPGETDTSTPSPKITSNPTPKTKKKTNDPVNNSQKVNK